MNAFALACILGLASAITITVEAPEEGADDHLVKATLDGNIIKIHGSNLVDEDGNPTEDACTAIQQMHDLNPSPEYLKWEMVKDYVLKINSAVTEEHWEAGIELCYIQAGGEF